MSKQALEGFRSKLREDQTLREEMTRALGRGPGQPRAPVEELVAFAKARGYEFSPDDVRANLELSDQQLDTVAGGVEYLKYGGIRGEAEDDKHKDWIELMSISF
jgi:predicted ribosomally synthesized peptide with nif11-like leader